MADAWLQARSSSMDEDLIPQVAAAAESSGSKDRPASWPAPKASMLKKSKMVQALRIRPGSDQSEQVLLRAEALRKAFFQAKVMLSSLTQGTVSTSCMDMSRGYELLTDCPN